MCEGRNEGYASAIDTLNRRRLLPDSTMESELSPDEDTAELERSMQRARDVVREANLDDTGPEIGTDAWRLQMMRNQERALDCRVDVDDADDVIVRRTVPDGSVQDIDPQVVAEDAGVMSDELTDFEEEPEWTDNFGRPMGDASMWSSFLS